jgi:hypothetical protein
MEHYRNVKLQSEEPSPEEQVTEEGFDADQVYSEEIGRDEVISS